MTSPKPSFLLLHGAWHTPHVFSRLIPLLNAHGYKTLAPHLPSSGANPALRTWDPDIEVIRNSATELAKQHDVIVVMHSNSGLTGTQALAGLDKKSCESRGWKGGVVRLVYICAFMFPEGWTQCPRGTGEGLDPDIVVDLESGTYTVLPEKVKGLMYQDVSEDEALEIAEGLLPQSLPPNWCTTTHAAWRWIPTTYVITLGDKASTVAAEEWLVKSAMENEPHAIEKVIRREVGHTTFWSQPGWTAEMLIGEAAGEV
ncbi:alpha/beta-hydrolase [Trematosphaeria pertusa]|uniref:Alpha/beta-hydrolase n=1 Tax=Trematosphaeria pertusa TaxID=390896 RepID=A0A6A6I5W4_9PLEO|nr:alpha/beta-hydrolase [Trematosphaeria pertusa]KAF2244960.1 alpha/beta-hydrolase [Trematosphaeria pertusa]